MAAYNLVDWLIDEPEQPETDDLRTNVSGGMVGLQPYPGAAQSSQADGVVDMHELFVDKVNCAPDVIRSYSETLEQGLVGPCYEDGNHTWHGSGAPLPDQTLGPSRNGYRGMADEPLPVRPPKPDCDADYDELDEAE